MICCNQPQNFTCYDSVDEIPEAIWQQLGCTENLYFNPKYLSAIATNNLDVQFRYLFLFDENGEAISFATIQIVKFYLDSVQNSMQSVVEKIKHFGRKLGVINPEKPFKILLCGNAFVSGEHGIFIKNNQDKRIIIKELAKSVVQYVNSQHELKNEVSAYMLKDFEAESLDITDELHDYNFYSFKVEPNMQLQIDVDWQTFDDYLASLKTKFRVKARKAIAESAKLEVKAISTENVDFFLLKMQELYKKVADASSFNLGDFSIETYKTLKQNLGEDYFVDVYCLGDTIVGFMSGVRNQNALDAHFVGIDYQLNRKYYIYQRMLYDYIKKAINEQVSVLNFGRTASEIKSSVGAEPQHLTIYLRHKQSIPNQILKLFLKRISPTPFRQNTPFKAKNLVTEV